MILSKVNHHKTLLLNIWKETARIKHLMKAVPFIVWNRDMNKDIRLPFKTVCGFNILLQNMKILTEAIKTFDGVQINILLQHISLNYWQLFD